MAPKLRTSVDTTVNIPYNMLPKYKNKPTFQQGWKKKRERPKPLPLERSFCGHAMAAIPCLGFSRGLCPPYFGEYISGRMVAIVVNVWLSTIRTTL